MAGWMNGWTQKRELYPIENIFHLPLDGVLRLRVSVHGSNETDQYVLFVLFLLLIYGSGAALVSCAWSGGLGVQHVCTTFCSVCCHVDASRLTLFHFLFHFLFLFSFSFGAQYGELWAGRREHT